MSHTALLALLSLARDNSACDRFTNSVSLLLSLPRQHIIQILTCDRRFLIIIPAVAQLALNKSKLVLVSAHIMDPHPNSILLTINSSLDLKGFTVKMDSMTLDLFIRKLSDQPFAKVYIAAEKVHGITTLGVTNQVTPLLYEEGWQQFVDNVLFLDSGPISVRGKTRVHLGTLHADVSLNRDLETPSKAVLIEA